MPSLESTAASSLDVESLDGVTVKILWDRLVSIVDQASVTHIRTAFSTIVRESNDFAASLLTPQGETLANSQYGLPSFVATQAFTLKHLLTVFDRDELKPGDVLISNDPWVGTGQAMDICLLAPIFHDGRVVAFAGSVAHSPDLGGTQRWNLSTDVFEEALRIPHVKLFDGGEPSEVLFETIRASSRLPDLTIGDLEAQLAALAVMQSAVTEMMDEYGLHTLDGLAEEITGRSERLMRQAIEAIPDGTYRHEIWSDGFVPAEASERDREPVFIRVAVEIDGSDLHVDLSGSSPQVAGPFNGVWTMSEAYGLYAVRMILVPLLPNNAGFYRPLSMHCPPGTVVNAEFPSPTLCRHVLSYPVCDAIFGALSQAIPDQVLGGSGSTPIWGLLLMGEDGTGRRFHRLIGQNGGAGAISGRDGYTVGFPGNVSNTPVEVMESTLPIIWECKEAIPDSGGPGRNRGGLGQRMRCRALADLDFAVINDRIEHPPEGWAGGGPGRTGRVEVAGTELGACSNGALRAGEVLLIESPGGGGIGDPLERDVEDLRLDIEEGLVSAEAARELYGRDPIGSGS